MIIDNTCCNIATNLATTDNTQSTDGLFGIPASSVLFIIIVLAVIILAGRPNSTVYGCYGGNYYTPGFLFTPQLDEMYKFNKHYAYAPDGFL